MTASEPTHSASVVTVLPAGLDRIVLIGFMGAGKTSVGRILAEHLGWEFLDLDTHLEARAGATVAELFAVHGEQHFRRVESSALANALGQKATVIALGGGTPEQLRNRLLLEQTAGTLIIFLEAPFTTLFDRCMLQSFASPDHVRPVLASPAEAEQRFTSRQPVYRRLARMTLATGELTSQQAAAAIVGQLRNHTGLAG
jgi:shikimate kinase